MTALLPPKTERRFEREALAAEITFAPPAVDVEAARRLAPPERRKRAAVFVVHGMGQQLRFETLDTVANGLYRYDVARFGLGGVAPARAAHVEFGDQRLERIEMRLRAPDGSQRDVDIYEGYWAPLTEGVATLRDVMRFLVVAGLHGVRKAAGMFQRWMFGALYSEFVPVRSLVYLLTALWVVLSLVVINVAIVAIPAARSPFGAPPKWASDVLFSDLTSLFNAALLVLYTFATTVVASQAASHRRSPRRRRLTLPLAVLSLVLFVLALFTIVAAGVAVPLLFVFHAYGTTTANPGRNGVSLLPEWIPWLGSLTPTITVGLGLVAGVVVIGGLVSSIVVSYLRQVAGRLGGGTRPGRPAPSSGWASLGVSTVVLAVFGGFVYGTARLAAALSAATPADGHDVQRLWASVVAAGPVWVALSLVGIVVRSFLIQYAGDVAVYVQSHTVDRFNEIRTKIKDTVRKTAEAVYGQRSDGQHFDYDEIFVVGHSLGSVIAYDTLNRLLLDDTASRAAGRPWNVAARTKLLLTFGSPLDKTAFVFTTQAKASMTQAREVLAALVQPLIDDRAVRRCIRWINIYSPWDIISGRLEFYDDPTAATPPVANERDPEAVTLLGAHTEYWRNWLVFQRLHESLTA